MSRRKRTSPVLEAARQRLAGLNSINPPPDFGPSLKLSDFAAQINDFTSQLDHYNQMGSTMDELKNHLDDKEELLRESSRRFLSATEAHYGPDSSQYQQAGGTRESDRKRSVRKPREKATSPAAA